MRLDKIPGDVFADAIDRRFAKSGIKPEEGLGAAIVELAGNLPYDVQRLAHETWDDVRAAGGKRAALDHLHATLSRLLAEQDTMFEALWQRLTLAQRAVLRAVVLQNGRELLSADTRARHRLGGRVQHPGRAGGAGQAGPGDEGGPAARGGGLAVPRVGGEEDVLRKTLWTVTLAGARRAGPAGAAGMGDVRLGQLRVLVHRDPGGLPALLRRLRRRRALRRPWPRRGLPGPPRSR